MGFLDWAKSFFRVQKQTTPAGTIEQQFGVQPAASKLMEDNINLWYAMYINRPPWETDCVKSIGLPGAIGRELSRHALTEFSATVDGSPRADFINENLQVAVNDFNKDLELGLCLGGIALKPYIENGKILVDAVTTGFTPTHFDGTGKVIGGVFRCAPERQGREWYVRMEYHDFQTQEDGTTLYVIENKAFRSDQNGNIGVEVALDTVDAWAQLQPHTEISGLERPLFAYFKPPAANDVDTNSKLGVSIYAGATAGLIKEADEQWERIKWEYKSGERKIFVDGIRGSASQFKDRLFEYGAFSGNGDFFHEFNPALRDDPLYNGFQRTLQRIEFNVGLAYGTISDPQSVEKTATEILAAKHRQYVTENAIQKEFEHTIDNLVYAMNAWCDLVNLAPAGNYEISFNWGDGILDDPETKRQNMAMDLQLVSAGIMSPLEFRMKHFKESEEEAMAMLPGVEELATEEPEEVE